MDLQTLAQRYCALPSSWKIVPLGEVLEDIVGGGTPSRNEPAYWSGDIPWLTVKDMKTRRPAAAQEHISARAVKESATSIIPPDTVITATRVGLGKVVRVPFAAAINQDLKALIVRSEVEKAYLEYWILSIAPFLEAIGSGTTVKGIRLETLRQLPFPLAPVREQRRIVAEIEEQFSRLDEAVANLKRVKANATRLVDSVLIDATAGRLVQPSSAAWRIVQVCEAGEILLGRQRAPQYLTGRWSHKYLRVANIKDDTIDFSDVEMMDFDEAHFTKYRLVPGDILVSEGQSPELLGQSAIYRGYDEPLCFQKTLHRFRAYPEITTPEFAQVVFRSHVRSGVFRRLGSITTNIGHLTLEKFKAAPFPLPPLDEQQRIVAEVNRRLSIVRHMGSEIEASLARAQALRNATLSRAFFQPPGATNSRGSNEPGTAA